MKCRKFFLIGLVFFMVHLLFIPGEAFPKSDDEEIIKTVNSKDIQDFVCIVNRTVHPNMERYFNTVIRGFIGRNDTDADKYAMLIEKIKRGGFGSGFVYVDSKGNNYIITNYHVIIGAYRLSVTFEDAKGERTVYKNLLVYCVDEDEDLAMLAFPAGVKPYKKGIPFYKKDVRSGTDIWAAGYPGIPDNPVWNLTSGGVANPNVKVSGMGGTFIQHGAAINLGNSGGPLLVPDTSSFLKYSIVGINTFIIQSIAGANFAIPKMTVEAFIKKSFEKINSRVALENRLTSFMELIVKATTDQIVFKDFAQFLSTTMINASPESTIKNLPNISGLEEIKMAIVDNPFRGIAWAVAYSQIEDPIYRKAQRQNALNVKPDLLPLEKNNKGGYTARILINGYPYRTEWIMDYGTWKLDEFIEDDGEYNDAPYLATKHPLGKKVIYSLSSPRDIDWYEIDIPKAGKFTVWTEGSTDTIIGVFYDPSTPESRERTLIGLNDNISRTNLNARVSENAKVGKIYVAVRLSEGRPGEYILCAVLE
jgi:hypothetical protein